MKAKFLIEVSIVLLLFVLTSCDMAGEASPEGRLQVVTTIGQIKDAVERVGGEHVEVTGLMGPGVDPHLYQASARDVDKLQGADIVFYNGLFLEAQMEEILEQMASRRPVVAVTRDIDRERLLASPTYQGEYDPHIWFDVRLWMAAVERIRDTLIEVDRDHADDYRANAEAYLEELEALDEYVQTQTERVPEERKVLITAHDAFNYFGEAYGFEVRGLQGISTASEASTADVQALAELIAERRIPAIFVESSVPRRNIEAVQAAVASRGFQVDIGGALFSDAMGDPDTPQGTYVGMVRHNVDIIVEALLSDE